MRRPEVIDLTDQTSCGSDDKQLFAREIDKAKDGKFIFIRSSAAVEEVCSTWISSLYIGLLDAVGLRRCWSTEQLGLGAACSTKLCGRRKKSGLQEFGEGVSNQV